MTLYSTENPGTGVTIGRAKSVIQVASGIKMTGAAGKITALLAALWAQAVGPTVFAGMVPQAAEVTYLVRMV